MGKRTVQIKGHSYDVHIDRNVYDLFSSDYYSLITNADHVGIIADEHVASLHLALLKEALNSCGVQPVIKLVPAGEQCKTLSVYGECHSFFLKEGFTRNSILIAFGGGAVGDLTGFVAATFMRGIRFIQCPTTILSHDSAVGGKTAINMPEGKNMVGSFHQPSAVLFETALFETLPPREVRSGMTELIKHAFISDAAWSEELLSNDRFSSPSIDWLSSELLKGIQVKADIVAEDEYEYGKRKFLNFGHTFGHAVEAVCGFGGLSHGESVMIGMAYSLLLSENFSEINSSITNRFIRFSLSNGYSFAPVRSFKFEDFLQYMKKDKKASFGQLNFVLLKNFGHPFVQAVTEEECENAFYELQKRVEMEE
ncbi:3-dehydroquinate synthase [Sporosarcina sp. USHLN248]|uniref:3-dehydroquinate synthase n=1 Tax=Sporosarcina sp. USHLN248 TaxID=3081300 RepID=UPI003015EF74